MSRLGHGLALAASGEKSHPGTPCAGVLCFSKELREVLTAGMCSLAGDACGYPRASPPAPAQPRPAAIPAALSGFSHLVIFPPLTVPDTPLSLCPPSGHLQGAAYAASQITCLPSTAPYPRVMPFHICTTQHLSTMNFVPILLPIICSILSTSSAACHISSTRPSPEQLSISGRSLSPFTPIFQVMVFDWFCRRTIGPVSSAAHPLPGQLSVPPFHGQGAQPRMPVRFSPTAAAVFKHSV